MSKSIEETRNGKTMEREKKRPYPKSVIFIIGNEFCERFSYYGMRTILVLYFRNALLYSENKATQMYHIFAMACFFTPVLGAIIADSVLGKFWTILSISVVYAIGNVVLSIAAIENTAWLSFVGLALIALGTGGIKPCVAAFGGDQFAPDQKRELQQFFSFFYVAINGGSLISTFLTPILRQDVACLDRDNCYPLAFGVPAALMFAALVLFIVGRFVTNYTMVPPQKDNVIVSVCRCVTRALCKKIASNFSSTAVKREHWLDYSDDKFDSKTIADVKLLMRVLFLYLPLPIFWALYDQQASRWTLQAIRMNGQLGSFIIKPDQIQVVNPFLVILMIPIFEYAIYPVMAKFRFNRPLQRMALGGILAGASFAICALMQLRIEAEEPIALQSSAHNHLLLVNGLPNCALRYAGKSIEPFRAAIYVNRKRAELQAFTNQSFEIVDFGENGTRSSPCQSANIVITESFESLAEDQTLVLYVSAPRIYSRQIDSFIYDENVLSKPSQGGARLYTLFALRGYSGQNFSVTQNDDGNLDVTIVRTDDDQGTTFGFLKRFEVEIKGIDVEMRIEGDGSESEPPKIAKWNLDQGATYVQLIVGDLAQTVNFEVTRIVDKNQISVFLQLIQYFVITCGEILFSITGLEFSYSQAPKTMKSVLQACWLLTMAFGNLIIVIIADLPIFPKQSYEFFFFAALMVLDIGLFAIIAYYYVPVKERDDEEEEKEELDDGLGDHHRKNSVQD